MVHNQNLSPMFLSIKRDQADIFRHYNVKNHGPKCDYKINYESVLKKTKVAFLKNSRSLSPKNDFFQTNNKYQYQILENQEKEKPVNESLNYENQNVNDINDKQEKMILDTKNNRFYTTDYRVHNIWFKYNKYQTNTNSYKNDQQDQNSSLNSTISNIREKIDNQAKKVQKIAYKKIYLKLKMESVISPQQSKQIIDLYQSPCFVYNENIIHQRCKQLLDGLKQFPTKTKAIYACKANTNPFIMKALLEAGIQGIDTVSVGECMIAQKVGFNNNDILYTENYISNEELKYAIDNKIMLNVGELSTLEKIGKTYPGTEVSVRLNPDIGSGECSHVITGGSESKFGIYYTQIDELKQIINKYDIKVVGIHQHIGSNLNQKDITNYVNSTKCIFETALKLTDNLRFINIGGGIGVPYKQGDEPLNLVEAFKQVSDLYTQIFQKQAKKDVEIWVEPGRFLVAESGTLLCTATSVKTNPFYTFIGTDTGMNHLIRPAFYGSYHHIYNATNQNQDSQKANVTICGNICESSDIFAKDREINKTEEGDILAIQNAGAYCFSMANNYNSRLKPPEIMITKDLQQFKVIRSRETYEQILASVPSF
ncbi:Alanine racemase/group IV decarboxylase, C-terminal [Pseudocohnilembus persalinus]|uniref:Alanine racemase/group IV decarboxylase, C-terminal n=1 Tax=Pseudocohnilembus persalinus TaxID=266149 RepID=A0A0V0R404_PSEPJ|nr:Alanine racemase/group IV decarboxylase, C-terminal [Pseudocohnilembus persalinus]|eukprot:KRX09219.1 Alanine racemase/group IV decarboxylase, C-terminal [Pseudocohnilembus persalinus]